MDTNTTLTADSPAAVSEATTAATPVTTGTGGVVTAQPTARDALAAILSDVKTEATEDTDDGGLTASDLLGDTADATPEADADASESGDTATDATATPTVPAEKKLLAEFSVADKDGELEIPDIALTFKANGKMHENVPLDKVVKLAQQGFYNEAQAQEVQSLRAQVPQFEQALQEQYARVQQFEGMMQTILTEALQGSTATLEREVLVYQQSMSPEAQLARANAQLTHIQTQQQQQQTFQAQQAQAAAFHAELAPKFDALEAQNPNVSSDEILGVFSRLTAPYLRNGRLEPQHFATVSHLIDSELVPYVESRNTERGGAKPPAPQTTTRTAPSPELARAKQEAAAAKRNLARVAMPGTTPTGVTATDAPKPFKFESANDFRAALRDPAFYRS